MIELLGGALHLLAEVGNKIGDTIPDEQLQAGDTLEVRFEVRPSPTVHFCVSFCTCSCTGQSDGGSASYVPAEVYLKKPWSFQV